MARAIAPTEDLTAVYDRRYASGYMDEDRFSAWSRSGVERDRVAQCLASVPATSVSDLLDYGCGTGGWSGLLKERFPGARLSGIDLSGEAIREACRRWPDQVFLPFDGGRAPFPDAAFDLVFTYHVWEHLADPGATARDIARVTRPGGSVVIICPCGNEGSFEQRLVSGMRGGLEPVPGGMRFFYEDPTHLRRWRTPEIEALMAREGFALQQALFAHQFFGAIEWIAGAGRPFARELFAGRPPAGLLAALRVLLCRASLQPLALAIDLAQAAPRRQRTAGRRFLLRLLWPVRLAAKAIGAALRALARLEWRSRSRSPNGSAQFLVFTKPA